MDQAWEEALGDTLIYAYRSFQVHSIDPDATDHVTIQALAYFAFAQADGTYVFATALLFGQEEIIRESVFPMNETRVNEEAGSWMIRGSRLILRNVTVKALQRTNEWLVYDREHSSQEIRASGSNLADPDLLIILENWNTPFRMAPIDSLEALLSVRVRGK